MQSKLRVKTSPREFVLKLLESLKYISLAFDLINEGFNTVMIVLWKSENSVDILVVFWKLCVLLVTNRSMQVGLSGF